jgi:ubiquinone/menaquinone biosynthesis C-methylase UbiE
MADQSSLKGAVKRAFDDVAGNYASSAVHRGGPELDALLARAALRGEERVLDAGCGPGHTALALAPTAGSVVGVDLSPSMLEQARRLAGEREAANASFEEGDVESLHFADGSFDLVTSRYSAHHYPHPERALAEFHRVLRPGGRLLLVDTVSPEDPGLDTFINMIEWLRDHSHIRDHRGSEWLTMLEGAGFHGRLEAEFRLDLDFESWVDRIGTPSAGREALRFVRERASREARETFRLDPVTGSFALFVHLYEADR